LSTFFERNLITGPPTHSVGGHYRFAFWRLSSSVTLHGGPAGGFTRAGLAMTSCRLQSYDSSTITLQGGPVVLRRHLVVIWLHRVVCIIVSNSSVDWLTGVGGDSHHAPKNIFCNKGTKMTAKAIRYIGFQL